MGYLGEDWKGDQEWGLSNPGIPRKVGKLMLIVIGQWKLSSCPQMYKERTDVSNCLCLSLREELVLKGEHWACRGALIVPVRGWLSLRSVKGMTLQMTRKKMCKMVSLKKEERFSGQSKGPCGALSDAWEVSSWRSPTTRHAAHGDWGVVPERLRRAWNGRTMCLNSQLMRTRKDSEGHWAQPSKVMF